MNRRDFLLGGAAVLGGSAVGSPVRSILGNKGAIYVEEEHNDYTAADYVHDGLVGLFDGIENEGYGVHTDSNGPWVDLVSGNEYGKHQERPYPQRLEDGFAWHNNAYIGFAGSYVPAIQIEIVFRLNSDQNSAIIQNDQSTSLKFIVVNIDGQAVVPLQYSGKTVCKAGEIGKRHSVSIKGGQGWTDGKETTFSTETKTGWGYNYYRSMTIAAYQMSNFVQTAQYFDGDIYCIRLYNRALTAAEISRNYKIDKARFNLPD